MAEQSTLADFDQLPLYQERRFVPVDADLRNKETVVALYESLISRAIDTIAEFEHWILDRSELEAALDQSGSVLYIRMTCQTDNPEHAGAYTRFIETIIPAVEPLEDRLDRRYLELSKKFPLNKERYHVYTRAVKKDIELFREENIPLKTQVRLLSQDYQTVCGAMTVNFQGKEYTLSQISKFLQEPDRSLRESAWRASAGRRLQDKDRLEDIFDKMCGLRNQIAANAGYGNFADYQFNAYHRFDYTPADCKEYHKTVARIVVPLWSKVLERRRKLMKLDVLRPWDLQADPLGRKPLKPFSQVNELIGGVERIFQKIHPDLGRQFAGMRERGLLDLESRKGKAPGGYQNTLSEARQPFIFMNAVGVDDDVRTLLHEGGHAFHCLACAPDPLHEYRHGPMEFNEVASMSMELLANDHLTEFYGPDDLLRSKQDHLEGVVHILAWVALIDAFQHWIYENPGHSREDRKKQWVRLYGEFMGPAVDWEGTEDILGFLWHRQLHVFEVPFYYIEYGIAQLGALQIWLNARNDKDQAIARYREALALGGAKPLPALFKAAGLRFDFSASTIAPLMEALAKELRLAL